jgi:hypothetical protein
MMPQELARTAHELGQDLRDLTQAMTDHRRAVEKADQRSKAGIIAGIIGIMVGLLATIYAINADETADRVSDLQEQVAADQEEARHSACIQFNVQRNEVRGALKASLLTLARAPITPEQQIIVDKYNTEVDESLPYRDCSEDGIAAYFKTPPKDPALK